MAEFVNYEGLLHNYLLTFGASKWTSKVTFIGFITVWNLVNPIVCAILPELDALALTIL